MVFILASLGVIIWGCEFGFTFFVLVAAIFTPTEIDLVLANFLILPHFFVCVNLNQAVLIIF